jgi:rRNA-processing protein FCF1
MLLVVDANVLIDYAQTDRGILALAAQHIGSIHVPRVILDEVEQLSEADCHSLGLTLVDEPLEILATAAETRGALSFEDHVCLLLAKQNRWTCVTNDKRLHAECEKEGVSTYWGLRLLIELVRKGKIDMETADATARAIHETNPRHITPEILDQLRGRLTEIE